MPFTMKMPFQNLRTIWVMVGCVLLGPAITSCEDPIDVDLDEGTVQLAVDAFLTDESGEKRIVLTETTPYFDNTTQRFADGATVRITDDLGKVYDFQAAPEGQGNYIWEPDTADTNFGEVGRTYTLSVTHNGNTFEASSTVNPVPTLDSVTVEFREEEFGEEEGYYATFFAFDLPNREDYYWIRTYRNGVFFDDPTAINVSVDGAFGSNGADGFLFIIPIREFLINDDSDPYKLGDEVRVELWAITEPTWSFLGELASQLTNNGLFATPAANIRTNIVNADPNSDVKAVGWFSVSAVSSGTAIAGQ